MRLPKLRFTIGGVLLLMFGIACGFCLNLETLRLLKGRYSNEAFTTTLPPYVIEAPDVLEIALLEKSTGKPLELYRELKVRPDGYVNAGRFGPVFVAGKTIEEARVAIAQIVAKSERQMEIAVDVSDIQSKAYYVVRKDLHSELISRHPITGNETVIDAMAATGVQTNDDTVMHVARPSRIGGAGMVMPVDWDAIANGGSAETNFQLLPGDRLVIGKRETAVRGSVERTAHAARDNE